ncbi:MAG: hypothetical protein U0R19_07735 [Bryobacteraceae bacterium]
MSTALPILSASASTPKIPGAQFAQHMALRGRHVFEASGCYWQSAGHGMYISLPPQVIREQTAQQTAQLLREAGILGVRFPSKTREGLAGGLYVFRGPSFHIENLHRNFRQKVRRGLERCEIRELLPGELHDQGLALNIETMGRQGRFDAEFGDPRRWSRVVDAVYEVPAMSAIGAFAGGQLAAYVICCREDGCLHIAHQMSRLSDLVDCPNHVLDFVVTRDAIADPGIEFVTMGWASLLSMEGLHVYKTRMGYDFEPHHCVIQIHPRLAPWLAARPVVSLATGLASRAPHHQTIALTATVLRGAALSRQAARESVAAPRAGSLDCQIVEPEDFSTTSPKPFVPLLRRAWWYLRNFGVRATLRQAGTWLRRRRRVSGKQPGEMAASVEPDYCLQAGDWVEVKSLKEIEQTLDSSGAERGLRFLPDMARFCGQKLRVHKRLERMFLEESRQLRKVKRTVLLEKSHCEGAEHRCDRCCFYYWREVWLKKTEAPTVGEVRS